MLREHFGFVAEIVAGRNRLYVGFRKVELFRKFRFQRFDRGFEREAVKPVEYAEHEHVLAAVDILGAEAGFGKGCTGQRHNRNLENGVILQRSVAQRIVFFSIAGKLQVFCIEPIRVSDDDAAVMQVGEVRFQCSGIHGDHDVKLCTRSINAGCAEL